MSRTIQVQLYSYVLTIHFANSDKTFTLKGEDTLDMEQVSLYSTIAKTPSPSDFVDSFEAKLRNYLTGRSIIQMDFNPKYYLFHTVERSIASSYEIDLTNRKATKIQC